MPSPPQIAAGLLALGIAGAFTFFGSNHKPAPKVPFPTSFDDLPKADKLVSAEPLIPRVIKAIPIPPAPTQVAELVNEAPPKDVCERHGGWKKIFHRHHHESWRCVFPRRRR